MPITPVRTEDTNFMYGVDQHGVRPLPVTRWVDEDGTPVMSVALRIDPEEIHAMMDVPFMVLDVIGTAMPPIRFRLPDEGEQMPKNWPSIGELLGVLKEVIAESDRDTDTYRKAKSLIRRYER